MLYSLAFEVKAFSRQLGDDQKREKQMSENIAELRKTFHNEIDNKMAVQI
jgi:hypothetical protein